ncbi:MAG: ABC-2 type transport system ATP-binding protein [Saprospiraceae bacterium]|jgi:ABC-2 type transport system ATP-binding protein
MNVLELNNVVKTYQKHIAVNDVSFNVPKGSIFGLLGPNGAGKTSLIRIITMITRADSGSIMLDGEKLNSRHPSQIGYMPEERGLYKKMKVGEHLLYLAQLKGLSYKDAKKQINHWFEKFEITDWWNKRIEELSKGMQQKIQFIATVVHQPKLLILDEPFSGLDPINTNLIKDEIAELNRKGTSIIFSTHRMEQVEQICQEIVLINQGKNVLQGDVHSIKQSFKEHLFEINYSGILPEALQAEDDANENYSIIKNEENRLTIKVAHDKASNSLLNFLMKNGVYINGFNEILPSLNEIFIKQIGEGKIGS